MEDESATVVLGGEPSEKSFSFYDYNREAGKYKKSKTVFHSIFGILSFVVCRWKKVIVGFIRAQSQPFVPNKSVALVSFFVLDGRRRGYILWIIRDN
jgi:hypothetical protein